MIQVPNTFLDPECPVGWIGAKAFVNAYHTVISAQRTVVRDTVRLLESRGWKMECPGSGGASRWSKELPAKTRTVSRRDGALKAEFYLALAELDGVGWLVLASVLEEGAE